MNNKLTNFLRKNFDIIETILSVLFVAALLLLMKQIPYSKYGLIVSLSGLAALYYLMSLKKTESNLKFEYIFNKVIWISYAIISLGILQAVLMEEKARLLLIIGIALMVLNSILIAYRWIFLKLKDQNMSLLTRALSLGIIGTYLLSLGLA